MRKPFQNLASTMAPRFFILLLITMVFGLSIGVIQGQTTLCDQYGEGAFLPIGSNSSSVTYLSSLSPGTFSSGNQLYIQGTLVIDADLSISNCTIKMGPAALINTQGPVNLFISQSRFFACDQMWKGIQINAKGYASVISSQFEDAQYCFSFIQNPVKATFINNVFNRNYESIKLSNVALATTPKGIQGNQFTCTSNLNQPYSGQAPLPGSITFCGIEMLNSSMTLGLVNKPNNVFDALQCGVFSQRSVLRFCSAEFKRMINLGNNFNGHSGGSGIIAIDGIVTNDLSGNWDNITEFFHDNAVNGITAIGATLSINFVDFSRNVCGIYSVNNFGGESVNVRYSTFNDLGLVVDNTKHCWGMYYEGGNGSYGNYGNNFYTSTQASTNNIIFGIQFIGSMFSGGENRIVSNNFYSHSPSQVYCVHVDGGATNDIDVASNTIKFYPATTELTRWGIAMINCTGQNNRCIYNYVQGQNQIPAKNKYTFVCGVHIQNSINLDVCYNTIDDGYRGFHIQNNNNPMLFSANDLHHLDLGLHLHGPSQGNPGEMGPQLRTMNTWLTGSNDYITNPAWAQTPTYLNSKIVTPNANVTYFPNHDPYNWFSVEMGNENYCNIQTRVQEIDRQVATGQYVTQNNIAAWESRRKVFGRLLNIAALETITDQDLSSFLQSESQNSAGKFAQFEFNLRQVLSVDSAFLVQISTTDQNLINLLVSLNDGTVATDSSEWEQTALLSDQIIDLLSQRVALKLALEQNRISQVNALSAPLASLPQTTVYEQARAQFLGLLLNKYSNVPLSVQDLNQVISWMGGPEDQLGYVAHDAFMLLPSQHDLLMEISPLCNTDSNVQQERAQIEGSQIEELVIAPNPANELLVLQTPGNPGKVELKIVDLLGKIVWEYSGDEQNFQIPVHNWANGTYIVLGQGAGRVFKQSKVVIQH